MSVRRLTDAEGIEWAVWEVPPKQRSRHGAPRGTAPSSHLDELQRGWLTFLSDSEQRRLSPAPDGWTTLVDAALLELLWRARRAER